MLSRETTEYNIINFTKEVYYKNGSQWRLSHGERQEDITADFYNNYIDSIHFFNNFWIGDKKSYCRGYYNYTLLGYLINKVVTINPEKTEKTIAYFTFFDREVKK